MVTVELRRPTGGGYQTAATLHVDATGTPHLSGQTDLFPTGTPIPTGRSTTGAGEQIRFDDQPEAWARNLKTILRTGYLVPVVVDADH